MADTQDEVEIKSVEVDTPTICCERKHKFVFNKCCFCVPLRTGSLILAYLFLVGVIVSGIYYVLGLSSIVLIMSQIPEASYRNKFVAVLVLNSVHVGLALFSIAIYVLLVVGLHKENRSFVKLFARFQLTYIKLFALPYIVAVIMGYTDILGLVIGLVILVLNIYCTLVMRSQYVKMGATVSEPVGRYKDGQWACGYHTMST